MLHQHKCVKAVVKQDFAYLIHHKCTFFHTKTVSPFLFFQLANYNHHVYNSLIDYVLDLPTYTTSTSFASILSLVSFLIKEITLMLKRKQVNVTTILFCL